MTDDSDQLHADSLVIDGLNAAGPHKAWIPLMKAAGLDGMVATIGWMQGTRGTLLDISFLLRQIEDSSADLMLATKASDIEDARSAGKTAVATCSQNTALIEDEVSLLDTFHSIGMRIVQLTYNIGNLVGDGCTEPRDAGLTSFGRAVIRRMNHLGLIVDGSHTGKRTTMEAMELSDAPFIFSHANARAVSDTPRNIDDEQIEACARTGGVIGVNAFGPFVNAKEPASVTLDQYLDHIDHIVRVAGIDHVGIGLDQIETGEYYGSFGVVQDPNPSKDHRERVVPPGVYPSYNYVPGLESISGMPLITAGLLGRGYTPADVQKVIGLNWMRVYRAVWGA